MPDSNCGYHVDAIRSLIRDCQNIADEIGWVRNKEGQYRSQVLECTLVALLKHYFDQGRSAQQPLTKITGELLSHTSFEHVPEGSNPELDLILSILLFHYDKGLLVRSKELISKTWGEITLPEINGKFVNGRIEPEARLDYHRLSLVLFFKYPESFLSRLNEYPALIRNSLWETPKHHFTIFNIGTEIPVKEIDSTCDLLKADLEREICRDFYLSNLLRKVRQAAVRAEIHIVANDSLVLFGVGEFLESMHELRLRLRERVLRLNPEPLLKRDAQPVWTHTVLTRFVDGVTESQFEEMKIRHLTPAGTKEDIKLEDVHLGLMVFPDSKAMLLSNSIKIEEQ